MARHRERLNMYGVTTDLEPLDWAWVDEQLETAGTYWTVASADRHPHPRPVWGVWRHGTLELSIGSLLLNARLAVNPDVTVHLDSGTDVVIVEGRVTGTSASSETIAAYDAKYAWSYDVGEYGPLTHIEPSTIISWRSAGWAGRDGFQQAARWRMSPPGS